MKRSSIGLRNLKRRPQLKFNYNFLNRVEKVQYFIDQNYTVIGSALSVMLFAALALKLFI